MRPALLALALALPACGQPAPPPDRMMVGPDIVSRAVETLGEPALRPQLGELWME
jgi:hypothetical protein